MFALNNRSAEIICNFILHDWADWESIYDGLERSDWLIEFFQPIGLHKTIIA